MDPVWKRRSVLVFFAIGFGLPWLGWTINALTDVDPPLRTVLFYMGDFMSVAGIAATYVAGGRDAVGALLRRAVRGAGVGWWTYALFLPLAWQLAARVVYGLRHGGMGPLDLAGFSLYLSLPALRAWTTGPLGEEFGWRGFFLPRLLTRYRAVTASLILGLIWAFWHYTLYVKSIFATLPSAMDFTVSVLCFTVLMTVLFFRTGGSILLAILFHWSVNVSGRVAEGMLPLSGDVKLEALRPYGLIAVLLTTLIIGSIYGWKSLGSRDDFVVERDLASESVAADRS